MVKAARALEDPRRLAGKWPYQWLFPGPNSLHVLANGQVAIPGALGSATVVSYQVPDGLRFALRGIVFAYFGTANSWNEGTAAGLSFTLQVVASGTRNVEFLQNVRTHLGSADQPYPLLGRLEFGPQDLLNILVTNGGGVPTGADNIAVGHLVGHTYPNSEAMG